MEPKARRGRAAWWAGLSVLALVIGGLSIVQAMGFWIGSAIAGEPIRFMWVDHSGPAITSTLIGVVAVVLGLAALSGGRGRPRSS